MSGTHVAHKLNALKVKNLKVPGTYEDGAGLRLVVGPNGSKRWVMRVTVAGKRVERGLGSYPDVSLEKARDAADKVRKASRRSIQRPTVRLLSWRAITGS